MKLALCLLLIWHGFLSVQSKFYPTPQGHGAFLKWNPVDGATAYNVYRWQSAGTPTSITPTPVTSPFYFDGTVVSGQTYLYAVQSVSPKGVVSALSTEISATIP
jgi:hypothetical protein